MFSANNSSISSKKNLRWIIDSGATSHMTFEKQSFSEFKDMAPFSVTMGDHSTAEARGKGTVKVVLEVNKRVIRSEI